MQIRIFPHIAIIWTLLTLIVGSVATVTAAPDQQTGGTAFTVDEAGPDVLHQVNLFTGATTLIGAMNNPDDIEGLAFSPGGTLFGADDDNFLVTIDVTSGNSTTVGALGADFESGGLAFDCSGNLWMTTDIGNNFFSVNPSTGAATLVGNIGTLISGLTVGPDGTIYGLDADNDNLVTIDPGTGAPTVIGPF